MKKKKLLVSFPTIDIFWLFWCVTLAAIDRASEQIERAKEWVFGGKRWGETVGRKKEKTKNVPRFGSRLIHWHWQQSPQKQSQQSQMQSQQQHQALVDAALDSVR